VLDILLTRSKQDIQDLKLASGETVYEKVKKKKSFDFNFKCGF
jgi:hypothetical protein